MTALSFNHDSLVFSKDRRSIGSNSLPIKRKSGLYSITAAELFHEATEFARGKKNNSSLTLVSCTNSTGSLIKIISCWINGTIPVLIPPQLSSQEKKLFKESVKQILASGIFDITPPQIIKKKNGIHLKLRGERISLILFTSGSTGRPKAVLHTFDSIISAAKEQNKFLQSVKNSTWLLSLPLYHIGGFMIFFRALQGGSSLVISKDSSVETISEYLRSEHITHLSLVPTQLIKLGGNPESFNGVKKILLGGAKIERQHKRIAQKIPSDVIPVYGSSETAAFVGKSVLGKGVVSGTILYKPLTGSKFLIKKQSAVGKKGILLVRSKQLASFIYGGEGDEFLNIRGNRYYRTTDMAVKNGAAVQILGRADRIIVTGGKKVSADEVELAIKQIRGVRAVYVTGIADHYWGEKICAIIEPEGTRDISASRVQKELSKKLSQYKVPKEIKIGQIPYTGVGKIDRKKITALFSQ